MFVQRVFEKRSNKTLLYYCSSKRVNGKAKKTMVERIGYLEDLQSQYPDPLSHFREIAKQKTIEAKEAEFDLHYSTSELFDFSSQFGKKESIVLTSEYILIHLFNAERETPYSLDNWVCVLPF